MNNMTTNNNNRIPELRFPGFTGEWEVKKLGDVACLKNGYAFKSDTYVEKGKYKIVTIANVKNGEFDIHSCNTIDNLPNNVATHQNLKIGDIVISMTGNVGRVCLINQQNCLLNQRVGLLEVFDNSIYKGFLYQTINSMQFEKAMILSAQGAAQPNIGKLDIESYIIAVPTLAEQQKIAECLSSLDEEIAAEAQKADALKDHKKGLTQQLFPAISNEQLAMSNCVPKLRFSGFTGSWEVKKLGEIAEKVNSRNRDKSETRVLTNSATEGVVDQNDYFDRDIAVKENTDNYHIVEINDFVYNPLISSSAPVGPISRNKIGKGIMSPLYTVFRFKSEDINFLEHFFNTTIWHKYLKSVANYGARFDRMAISTEDFYSMPILLPPTLAEQQKIADCLSELDEMISAQQQKVEALKEHKKGLMQKLFPKMSNTK